MPELRAQMYTCSCRLASCRTHWVKEAKGHDTGILQRCQRADFAPAAVSNQVDPVGKAPSSAHMTSLLHMLDNGAV